MKVNTVIIIATVITFLTVMTSCVTWVLSVSMTEKLINRTHLLLRIANSVTQLGWIANPAQREQQGDTEHPPRRKKSNAKT